MPDDASAPEANRLYWESDLSVAAIAERLDTSRRALYDLVEPFPAGAACALCGGAMRFANRTARDRGEAVCADCGAEADVTAADEPGQEAAAATEPSQEASAAAEPSQEAAAATEPSQEAGAADEPSQSGPAADRQSAASPRQGEAADRQAAAARPAAPARLDDRTAYILTAAVIGVVAGACSGLLLLRRR
jgi:uncharacterized Zn finger protein (UPF0148 family)